MVGGQRSVVENRNHKQREEDLLRSSKKGEGW
jgi:hypothetical protein